MTEHSYTYTVSVRAVKSDSPSAPIGPVKVELTFLLDFEGMISYSEYATRDLCPHIRGRDEGEPIGIFCNQERGHSGGHRYPDDDQPGMADVPRCMSELDAYWDSGVRIRRFCARPRGHDGDHGLGICGYTWHRMVARQLTRVHCGLPVDHDGGHRPASSLVAS